MAHIGGEVANQETAVTLVAENEMTLLGPHSLLDTQEFGIDAY
jgi:hypothetical protein